VRFHPGQRLSAQAVPLSEHGNDDGGKLFTVERSFSLMEITPDDMTALRRAVQSLEHPGLAARLTNMVGKPIELIGHTLPAFASKAIATATSNGLEVALKAALRTMQQSPHAGSNLLHKALATASGAVGGAFGLMTLAIELPVSTIIILRSIADIARSEGENLSDPETALSCVQVFALGGRSGSSDASESGYFAVRGMLAKTVTEAARFVAERGVVEQGAPVLIRFITQVASRFGAVVTQKVVAQALPVVGALGGMAYQWQPLRLLKQHSAVSAFCNNTASSSRWRTEAVSSGSPGMIRSLLDVTHDVRRGALTNGWQLLIPSKFLVVVG
jgi:EcsC protein family